jgi:beta-mannosidase
MESVPYSVPLADSWQLARYDGWAGEGDYGPREEDLAWIAADVPGSVHYDLVWAGLLENPYASSEAARAAEWVAKSDWLYRHRFPFRLPAHDPAGLGPARVFARFAGIDTFADLWLNGKRIGRTANAHRSYEIELPDGLLRADGNTLLVHVKSHYRMIAEAAPLAARMGRSGEPSGLLGKSLIRRYQRSFYSNSSLLNLGTGVLGIGINGPVELRVAAACRLAGSSFRVEKLLPAMAEASVRVTIDRGRDSRVPLRVEAALVHAGGEVVATDSATTSEDEAVLALRIASPELWWPAGYGRPALYRLVVGLYAGSTRLDVVEKRVGLKRVEIVRRGENGKPVFFFRVNGRPILVRGFNIIPLDYLKVHGPWDAYARIFTMLANANATMIRCWGGGALEEERFYDACDERGIMLWQDFFLHSNVYPDYDERFVSEFRAEAIGLLERLRDHACLSLLCGGNEQEEGWDEWGWKDEMDRFYGEPLIRRLLPELAARFCPGIPYIENSPHAGKSAQSPVEGDMHCWGNFYNATKDPQFVTETCWNLESYSRPETLKEMMGLDVDDDARRGWHEEWKRVTGLSLIIRFPFSGEFDVSSLRGYLRSLEIEQARADYSALGMLRLRSPSCSGILYWSLNKGGPLFGFGCVDYLGYPLMSYYVIKRLFADVVIGAYVDGTDVRVVAANAKAESVSGVLELLHMDAGGRVLRSWKREVAIAPGRSVRLLDADGCYEHVVDRTTEFFHARFSAGGETVAEDMLYLCPFSEFRVAHQELTVRASAVDSASWSLEIESSAVSKMIEIEGNQKFLFSDNYFALMPGTRKRVSVMILERTRDQAPSLAISSADGPKAAELTLP